MSAEKCVIFTSKKQIPLRVAVKMAASGAIWSSDSESKMVICCSKKHWFSKLYPQPQHTRFLKGWFTHRLSVIHTLQQESVVLSSFTPFHFKDVSNRDEEVIFDVRFQIPLKKTIRVHLDQLRPASKASQSRLVGKMSDIKVKAWIYLDLTVFPPTVWS